MRDRGRGREQDGDDGDRPRNRGFGERDDGDRARGGRGAPGRGPGGRPSGRGPQRHFDRRDDRPYERRGDRPYQPRGPQRPFDRRDDRRDDRFERGEGRPFEERGERPSGRRFERPYEPRAQRPFRRPFEDRPTERPADTEGGDERGFERPRRAFDRPSRPFERGPRGGGYGGDRGPRRGPPRPGPARVVSAPPGVDARELIGEGEEVVAGRRPVSEAFTARREAKRLLVVPDRRAALESLVLHATTLRLPIVEVEGGTLTSLTGFDGHQGVALVVAQRQPATVQDMLAQAARRGEAPFMLILDSLEDPQNLGTLLRSAEACGVHGVIYPSRHAAPLTAAAIKSSAGASEHLLLAAVDNLPGTLADLRSAGLRLIGADEGAPLRYSEADLRGPLALVVGSEERGISGSLRRRLDMTVRIPMRGKVGSLNAAVAGSVLLFAAADQRGIAESGDRTADGPTDQQPADEAAEQPAEEFAQQPADEAAEQPANEAAGEVAEQPAEEFAEQPAEQPAKEPAAPPAEPGSSTDDDMLLPGEPAPVDSED